MDAGEIAILALAGALACVPRLVDRWALRHGASPEALIALATVTLAGITAVPIAFAICTSGPAAHSSAASAPALASVAGLLLVAIAAGRTLARVITIRRGWKALAWVATTLQLPVENGVTVLPVGELLAFAAGTDAFISQGLLEQLNPAERLAVIEHEREHAQGRHGRLLAAARAVTHGAFDLPPVRRAAAAIDRELDVLADRAAAQRLGDPRAIKSALQTIATHTTAQAAGHDASVQQRLERLEAPKPSQSRLADDTVRLTTLAIGIGVLAAICLSIHTNTIWLGVSACTLLLASLYTFTRPTLGRQRHPAIPASTQRACARGRRQAHDRVGG
jgi:Zn-dependent protease with chaperone function